MPAKLANTRMYRSSSASALKDPSFRLKKNAGVSKTKGTQSPQRKRDGLTAHLNKLPKGLSFRDMTETRCCGLARTPCLKRSTRLDNQQQRAVSFDKVHIREYKQTVGDNPSVSRGPPIGLDWAYTELGWMEVEHFENGRDGHRHGNTEEMVMTYAARVFILEQKCGIPKGQVIAATKAASRAQRQRRTSAMMVHKGELPHRRTLF